MKIKIDLYNEDGTVVIGHAIETDCQSLIINGVQVLQEGGVHAELRQFQQEQQADNLVQMFCPDADVPVELN